MREEVVVTTGGLSNAVRFGSMRWSGTMSPRV